jgi:hypothetical protein
MVYVELVLKKYVDWSTLKELIIGDHIDQVSIMNEEAPINVKKMLAPVKPRKLAIPDEEVV